MLVLPRRNASISFQVCLAVALLASLLLASLLFFSNPSRSSSKQARPVVQLLAAAGLREPIEEIAKRCEEECGVHVDIQFGGSNSPSH